MIAQQELHKYCYRCANQIRPVGDQAWDTVRDDFKYTCGTAVAYKGSPLLPSKRLLNCRKFLICQSSTWFQDRVFFFCLFVLFCVQVSASISGTQLAWLGPLDK